MSSTLEQRLKDYKEKLDYYKEKSMQNKAENNVIIAEYKKFLSNLDELKSVIKDEKVLEHLNNIDEERLLTEPGYNRIVREPLRMWALEEEKKIMKLLQDFELS